MPHSRGNLPVEWVSSDIIRQAFNDGQYYEKARRGQLRSYVKRTSHPAHPPQGEPVCTRSQIVVYYSPDGDPVALVHQYLRPNGQLGASGLPDPKRLFLEDRILSVRSTEQ